MDIILKSTAELNNDPSNVRLHNEKNISVIKSSLVKFGQQKPIVIDDKGIVIAGNGTLEAARELGWEKIKCVVTELDETNKTAFAIADNRTAELADWDQTALDLQLKSLADLNMDMSEFDFDIKIDDPTLEPNEKDDEVPEVDDSNELGIELGQVWKLGNHRLMCGDSTKKEDVDKLMDGQKADMVFTDPPYGMDLDTDYSKLPSTKKEGNKKYKPIENDDKQFDASFILNNYKYCEEIFLFGADYYCHTFPQNSGSWIVWDKRVEEKFDKMFGSSFELCWSKAKHKREIARFNNTLFGGDIEARNKVHPTQKPTLLIEWFFNKWGEQKNRIVDLFLGSGSTLIACEKTDRQCFGMEIDPHYCNVIIKRWEDYTGKKAERII